jgi:hypothetical protein
LLRGKIQRYLVLNKTDELQWLCKLTSIITIVKSRRMYWDGKPNTIWFWWNVWERGKWQLWDTCLCILLNFFCTSKMITVSHILSHRIARSYMEHDLENNVAGWRLFCTVRVMWHSTLSWWIHLNNLSSCSEAICMK